MNAYSKKIVVHDVGVWLARTKTWLYSEVTQIGDEWEPWAVANRTANLSEFPFENLFSLKDHTGYVRWFLEMVFYRLGLTRQCLPMSAFIKKLRPAIIHSHFGPIGWRNLKLVESVGAKHVVSFYGYDVTKTPRSSVWQRRYKDLFNEVGAVLCEGPHMADAIQKIGCPQQKIHIYHLGVNLASILFKKPSWKTGKILRILMAATFTEKKGFPYGLKAIGLLKKRCPKLEIMVTIVGDATKSKVSQNEKKKIDQVIKEERLANIITMKGYCSHSDLFKLAGEHDVFLSPSVTSSNGDTEGGAPVSIIEMAAAGMIIVSTNHCDIPYILGRQNSRILVDERDSDGLSDTLDWLVENSDQWTDIALENRSRIEKEFNLKDQGPALARIYETIV